VHQVGGPEVLRYEENVPLPQVTPKTVLIKNYACGVNYIDVYHRTGLYKLDTPFIPGRDGAGVVTAVGEGVSELKVGDRVAHVMQPSYAEYTLAPIAKVVPLPDKLSFEEGAALMTQGLTAHYLVKGSYNIKKGDRVLVHAAAGGLGGLVVQLCKKLGASLVIGTTSSSEKAAIATKAGCDHVILYTQLDFLEETKRITEGQGVNVVYDSVGKDTFSKSLDCLAPRGFMVILGNSSGPVPPVDPLILSNKGSLSLVRPSLGHYILNRQELLERADEMFGWALEGSVKLSVLPSMPLQQATEAHKLLESRQTAGKLILTP
jgi:NADPH2:quinone reductase